MWPCLLVRLFCALPRALVHRPSLTALAESVWAPSPNGAAAARAPAAQPRHRYIGQRAIELGSGPGLAGLMLARLGAQVRLRWTTQREARM